MNDVLSIYEALPTIASELGAIAKTRKSEQGWGYRGIEDFLNSCNPLLSKHRVTVSPNIRSIEYEKYDTEKKGRNNDTYIQTQFHVRAVVEYTFYAGDGTHITCSVCAEGLDFSDKASNKVMSFAMKYALMQIFSVPTEDIVEGDADNPEVIDEAAEVFASQVAQIRIALGDSGTQEAVAEDYLRSVGKLRDGMTLDNLSQTFAAMITNDEGALVRMIGAIDVYKTNVDAELNDRAAEPGTTADEPPF